ncbi:MAG: hypothetical protein HC871_17435, partial [Rhizobiales bacterium]|nr:hypothetical protein [Hyphomicrobiales bacterium]
MINGATASDEPQGLVGNSGITTVAGSDPLTWPDILLFRETVELANATPTGWPNACSRWATAWPRCTAACRRAGATACC